MRLILILLMLYLPVYADPNSIPIPTCLTQYWTQGVLDTRIESIKWDADNKYTFRESHKTYLSYEDHLIKVFVHQWLSNEPGECSKNLLDFAHLSRNWRPIIKPVATIDDVVVIPSDPNEPADVQICFTIGGKHHLYSDCQYLKGKEWKPCLCDPNNICLSCIAEKARKEEE